MEQTSADSISAIVAAARARDGEGAAVIATDAAGDILYWNDAAHALYGWRAEEAIGRNVIDVTPTRSTSDEASRIMERLRSGKEWSGQFILRRRDGSPIMAHVTNVPVRSGHDVIGIVGVSHPST